MPHFSILTLTFTTQRLTRGKSVLRLFDILWGIHSKLENYGFHKQNKAKRNAGGLRHDPQRVLGKYVEIAHLPMVVTEWTSLKTYSGVE